MGMQLTKYTKPEYVAYVYRRQRGGIGVTKSLPTAIARREGVIIRACVADHCYNTSNTEIVFTEQDQSYAELSAAIESFERTEDGDYLYSGDLPTEPVDYL